VQVAARAWFNGSSGVPHFFGTNIFLHEFFYRVPSMAHPRASEMANSHLRKINSLQCEIKEVLFMPLDLWFEKEGQGH
jgi:hypothetical protein